MTCESTLQESSCRARHVKRSDAEGFIFLR